MLHCARWPIGIAAALALGLIAGGCAGTGERGEGARLTPADFKGPAQGRGAPAGDSGDTAERDPRQASGRASAGTDRSGVNNSGQRGEAVSGGASSSGESASPGTVAGSSTSNASAERVASTDTAPDVAESDGELPPLPPEPAAGGEGAAIEGAVAEELPAEIGGNQIGDGPGSIAEEEGSEGDAGEGRLVVDAMVGQVNGKPIYASEIFKSIGEQQLRRLGRTQNRLRFRREVERLIFAELQSRITNALILREAERELSEREKKGLRGYVQQERQKILSQHEGVLAKAEAGVLRRTGRTLEEELEARRQSLLVEKYRREKLFPRVHVTRQEVERYYRDHYDEFNEPATATVRIIKVSDERTAEAVSRALAEGTPFEEVARRHSEVLASRGGQVPEFRLDEDALRWPAVVERVRELEPGERSERIAVEEGEAWAWVKLEALNGGSSQSLEDVFLQIERRLQGQKFGRLSRQYIRRLMEEGNFTPVDRMARELIEVAMARYARPR